MSKLVSFLIPTRNRPTGLSESIKSIIYNADDSSCVEIMIYVDDDDGPTERYIRGPEFKHLSNNYSINVIIGPRPPKAYGEIHLCYNKLFENSTGEFVVSFNDDTKIMNFGWDVVLKEYSGKICILRAKTTNHVNGNKTEYKPSQNPFPIVHRRIPELLGCFGWHPSLDAVYEQYDGQPFYYHEDRLIMKHGMDFPSEHIIDGITTQPASWRSHRGRVNDEIQKVKKMVEAHDRSAKI